MSAYALLCFAMIFSLLSMTPSTAQATQEPKAILNPLDALTGKVWMQSAQENKLALLYGVECSVAIEYIVTEKFLSAKNKNVTMDDVTTEMSLFPMFWITVFENTTREHIAASIDAWYNANTGQLDRPVFDVLWYELMEPKLKAMKKQ